jgi:antitoxin component YwqK of YwqJK toxin-antitoxin module
MKIIIYFNLLLLVCSCSQEKSKEVAFSNPSIPKIYTLKSSKEISSRNDTIYLNTKKYSGYLYELYPNQKDTIFVSSYINGLQNGTEKKWFPNRQNMEIRSFTNGQKNGKQTAFWENGNKKFEFIAKNDVYEGEMKEWNNEGKLIHLANYKNGQENGTQKLWYDNGKIRANYVLIDGKRYGLLGTKNCRNVSDSIFSSK